MFWKEKVSWFLQIEAFLRQRDLDHTGHSVEKPSSNIAEIAKPCDAPGIARLLNQWFEVNPKCSTAVTVEWVLESFVNNAIWIVIKDRGGTIRGCVCSTQSESPYPSNLPDQVWGIVDWFCVHPLWRSKGLGSTLLETLDYVTCQRGRKCHVFLKEGLPLPFDIPVYSTFLRCRRAGNASIVMMPSKKGIYPYMTRENATGLPLVRVDLSVINDKDLDTILPPCIVFSSCGYLTSEQGWKTDSLVSMYAFRWIAGKWLGSKPTSIIV